MCTYTEKSMQYLDELYIIEEKAELESYFIRDELYSKEEKVLDTPERSKKFSRYVGDFINRNSSKLTTIGPLYLVPFNYSDKNVYYELFNVTEKEIVDLVKKVIAQVNEKAKWRLITQNPIFVLFYCVIRYFTIKKDSKQLNNALIITSLAFYPSMFTKYFRYPPNEGIMQYTIDNLSKRFLIKNSKHIFGTLSTSIQNSWKFHEKDFIDGSDKEVIRFIQRIRNDQNSLMKKIANEYRINHSKGLIVTTSVDSYEDSIVVDNENDSNKVENTTNKIVTKLLINGVNLKLCDFAANATRVSKIELRNYLSKIITEKNNSDMKAFVESILFLYLYDEKHTFEEINSKQFVAFALLIFKKTNSKNENILNIKNTLDKWGKDSGIYSKFTRIATRVDYSKAIFLYFIMAIQQYNN